jgi:hypothetical protein
LPLSSLLATEQIFAGDTVTADIAPDAKELVFSKSSALFQSAAAAHGSVIESSAIL